MPELASWISLEGCFNFRDLGGYASADGRRMRTGRVFRSDGLQDLTPADLDHLCDALGLGLVIDLRSGAEVEAHGCGAIAERAEIVPVPLFELSADDREKAGALARAVASGDMGELYYTMLEAARAPIARVVDLLARAETPAVFHCAAGKDRTGVISALLLSLLDVPEDTIVADYAFSRENLGDINARLDSSETYRRWMADLPEGAWDADPAAMRGFLARVQEAHGGFGGWAEGAGLGGAVRERLRARLLTG